jgi:hypothetical protein
MSAVLHLPETVAVAAAVFWPLAAGVAVVLWSRIRAAERRRRLALMDERVRGQFRSVESQPVPERFDLVVDALEESALDARPPAPATVRRRGRKPAFEK